MLKNKLYRKLLVGGITGTLVISSGVMAFAATSKSSTTTKSAISGNFDGGSRGQGKGFMQKGDFNKCNLIVDILKTEVTAGVITQAESDAITAYLTAKEATNKTAMEAQKAKIEAMTDAERKAYMQANKPAKTDILTELVTAKLLTQAQADTIKAAMPKMGEMGKDNCGHGMGKGDWGQGMGKESGFDMNRENPLAAVLKAQVTAGVITQAEADSATAFIKTKEAAEKAKYEAITDTERKAYMQANKSVKDDILAELVTAGIFTQSQADKIQAATPKRSEMGKDKSQMGKGHGKQPAAATTGTSEAGTKS